LNTVLAFYRLPVLFLWVFLFSGASFLMAQNESGDGDDGGSYGEASYIAYISISGLGRTRFSTAERPLRRFIGMETGQITQDEVFAAIMATGIMEPISVEIDGQVLRVEVRERWTIFPIPVAMGGTGGAGGGLAFLDANAFGLNDQLFLAGFFHSDGWAVSAGYIRSSRGGRAPGWSGVASFSRGERHDRDQNNNALRSFDLDAISVHTGIGFPLIADSDFLTASALLSFNDRRMRNRADAERYGMDRNLRLFGAGAEFAVRRNHWDGYFLSQEAASARYFFHADFDRTSFQSVQIRGVWERSLIPGFRFNLRSGIVFMPDAPVLFESSPSAAQVNILPRDFSARNYAGLSAGLEKRIFRINAGTLSVTASYQAVYSYSPILGDYVDHGIMGALFFYLNRLALPALGLGVAYNVNKNFPQAFFSFGMSF